MKTPWGYEVTGADDLPNMLSESDFSVITAGKYSNDIRIRASIDAASDGIRNYCGWHVCPPCACVFSERLLSSNGRIKRNGPDLFIQLPATFVSEVGAVYIDGEAFDDFAFETNGMLRLFDVPHCRTTRKTVVTVEYTAGIPDSMAGGIRELVSGRVSRALNNTNGVSSETAGGVSISYNSSWVNGGGAGALQTADVDILDPFKLREVF